MYVVVALPSFLRQAVPRFHLTPQIEIVTGDCYVPFSLVLTPPVVDLSEPDRWISAVR